MIYCYIRIGRGTIRCAEALAVAVLLFLVAPAPSSAAEERTGAWVDEVVASVQPSARQALSILAAGEAHVYAFGISDANLYDIIREDGDLEYERHVGTSAELAFNPYGPVFEGDGGLNPFSVPEIREAVNWLLDRNYIAGEIYGGMARPRYLPINSAFADYARFVDVARMLEQRYRHDPGKAEAVIGDGMRALGAEKENGRWHYDGEVVELRFLIRSEDERREIGDYIASLLENIGFVVRRDYRTAEEAAPVWSGADPAQGRFHLYTGGWISTIVRRDDAGTFNFYYTPRGLSSPLWQAYRPSEEFDDAAERLGRRDFGSMEERSELFAVALELSLRDSVRIWLVDQISVSPRRKEISVAADLSGGISGAYLWPYTLRFADRVGGTVRIATQNLLDDPWNPLDGSNWIFDMMFTRATSDYGVIIDPYTGLYLPQRIERGEVTIQEGLPVEKTHDWVSLEFSDDEIEVPEDAWIDWDAEQQRFITVAEKHPEGLTARRKSVAYYPEELYRTKWHDGSRFSPADVVMGIILTFDRADEDSKLFDESQLPAFESFKRHFRGVRIKSKSPLAIETYSHSYSLDAENNVATWYPDYAHGPGSWHALTTGILAEKAGQLAFSNHKADRLQVEWMSMIAGPGIGVLGGKLREAREQNYIPYEPVLGKYIDKNEASERWRNLQDWYDEKGHFWVGTGPFYLQRVYSVEKNVHLRRFEDFPDHAGKWERFKKPVMPEVSVSGPRRVSPGDEVEFVVDVSFEGRPYPAKSIKNVIFLWYDAADNLVRKGEGQKAEDGKYLIKFSGRDTQGICFGCNRVEVAVVSSLVSIPVFEKLEFLVLP